MTGPSRCVVVASLAPLPAIATATVAAAHGGAVVDPIFAAIEQHRRELDAFESIDEISEPGRFEATGMSCMLPARRYSRRIARALPADVGSSLYQFEIRQACHLFFAQFLVPRLFSKTVLFDNRKDRIELRYRLITDCFHVDRLGAKIARVTHGPGFSFLTLARMS